jgi:hypothetical protein
MSFFLPNQDLYLAVCIHHIHTRILAHTLGRKHSFEQVVALALPFAFALSFDSVLYKRIPYFGTSDYGAQLLSYFSLVLSFVPAFPAVVFFSPQLLHLILFNILIYYFQYLQQSLLIKLFVLLLDLKLNNPKIN